MILESLGCSLEAPWGGFWQEKIKSKKWWKKKGSSRLPRRVTRTPVRRDFREDNRWERSNTPSLILTDGRADCLRFASPAEATSCLLVMIPRLLLLLLYQLEILQNLEAFIFSMFGFVLAWGRWTMIHLSIYWVRYTLTLLASREVTWCCKVGKNKRDQEEKRCPLNTKKTTKINWTWSLADPKWSQDAPQVEPKSRKMHRITESGYQMAPKSPLLRRARKFLVVFGSSLGSPKGQKIGFFLKKSRPRERFFIDFCSDCRISWFFRQFWVHFGWKFNVRYRRVSRSFSYLFQHGDPHETLYFAG